MNQSAEECRDLYGPTSAALAGHRLSLTDLFCTERLPAASPTTTTTAVVVAAAGCLRVGTTPNGFYISATNPFIDDLLPARLLTPDGQQHDYLMSQPYLHDQFQWKHSLQTKYRVVDYISCHPNVMKKTEGNLGKLM